MLSGISIICFAACYAIAFAPGARRPASDASPGTACALAVAHARRPCSLTRSILVSIRADTNAAARSPPPNGCSGPPGCSAIVYLAALFYLPRSADRPRAAAARARPHRCARTVASTEPLAAGAHVLLLGTRSTACLLLFGTVAVCIGFLAGLMYLAQSYALKHARSPSNACGCPASNGSNASTAARSPSRPC